jgi:hypothetical protein
MSLGEWFLTFLRHYNPSKCWELLTQQFHGTTLLPDCRISEGRIYFIWNSKQWRWSSQISPNTYTSCASHHCESTCAKHGWLNTLSNTNTTIPMCKYGHKLIPSEYLQLTFLRQQTLTPDFFFHFVFTMHFTHDSNIHQQTHWHIILVLLHTHYHTADNIRPQTHNKHTKQTTPTDTQHHLLIVFGPTLLHE